MTRTDIQHHHTYDESRRVMELSDMNWRLGTPGSKDEMGRIWIRMGMGHPVDTRAKGVGEATGRRSDTRQTTRTRRR